MLGAVLGSFKAQIQMTRRNIEDLLPVLTMPVFTFVFMAIFENAGRSDLAGFALVAPLLLTVAQMGLFIASELMSRERYGETLELLVATTTPFTLVLFPRIAILAALGLLGFVEGWLVLRLAFNVEVTIQHPAVFVAAALLTVVASTCTAMITTALFCLRDNVRTFQTSIAFPIFILGGVIVPVTYLPDWLEPLSRVVFLYWAANLMRDSMTVAQPEDVLLRLGAIFLISIVSLAGGALLMNRMLDSLRREGSLGLR